MNTLATSELARTRQDARVQHAMHVRALKDYRRSTRGTRDGRARIASILRRLATRLDGRAAAHAGTPSHLHRSAQHPLTGIIDPPLHQPREA